MRLAPYLALPFAALLAACRGRDTSLPDAAGGVHHSATPPNLVHSRAAVPFPVLLPDDLPWLRLVRADPAADRLVLRYEGNGIYVRVEQGPEVAPSPGALAAWPPHERGETSVKGRPATWLRGSLVVPSTGSTAWRDGPLRLFWTTEVDTGYLLESDFYTFEQLVALAETVGPCTPPADVPPDRPYVRYRRPVC